MVVSLFAVLHDSRRLNEHHDPGHGPRAAAFAKQLRGRVYDVSDEEQELLVVACAGHTSERLACGHYGADVLGCGSSGFVAGRDYSGSCASVYCGSEEARGAAVGV